MVSESTDRPLTTMTYLAEARRLAGNGTREGAVIAMLLAHIEAQDAIFEMRDSRPATATEQADALRAVAEECRSLAMARGQFPDGWTIQTGMGQIIAELHEWLSEAAWSSCCGRVDRSGEKAGDALAALLSVMMREGIDPATALAGAIRRNRERVERGE